MSQKTLLVCLGAACYVQAPLRSRMKIEANLKTLVQSDTKKFLTQPEYKSDITLDNEHLDIAKNDVTCS